MKSLLRMSDEELQSVDAGEGLAPGTALGIAGVSSVLAFAGLMLRYSPGDDVPMAGMDSIGGQVLWAAGLGMAMIGGAILIRSLFMKRLQWAVMFSLMIHFSLCVALKVVVVDVPMAMAAEVGDSDLPPRDITMPDYGGSESQSQQEQTWERPTEVDVPEAEQQQLERQEAELEVDSQIDPVEMQRRVAEAAVPERQQPEQERLEREQQIEIERQQREADVQRPQEVEAPEIQTADTEQPDLESQEMNRSETELREMQRQMEAFKRQNDLQVSAANVERSEVRPENDLRAEARQRQREAMEAQVADSSAESVDVAAATDAPQITTDAQQMAAQRQADADLTAQARSGNGPQMSTPDLRVSSAAPSRSQSENSNDATPSGGGAAALQRSSSASGRNTSAADATAESVSVAAVSGASAPNLTASNAASDVARGESSVPTGAAAGGGAPAMTSNPFGVSSVQSGTVGRSQGSQSGPQMGNAVAANAAAGNGQRSATRGSQSSDAVGTQAAEVSVGGAAPATDAAGRLVASGPSTAASDVSRNGIGLPSGSGSQPNASSRPSGSGGDGMTLAMNTTGRTGLTGRATEPSARLSGNVASNGAASGSPTGGATKGRRPASASLPEGMLQAERSGALVMAGPQAAPSGGSAAGGLNGPRLGSLPRQSAGLPGAGRGASLARRRPSLPGGIRSSQTPARATTGGIRPKLATEGEVAALINRAVPGISAVAGDRISAGFSMRTPEARAEAVGKLGGSNASEAAVQRALEWLAAHQYATGRWSIHDPNCKDHTCTGRGKYEADPAATGLALLAFLGAGHTHRTGDYQREVQLGLDYLMRTQDSDGNLFPMETKFARFYSHGMAAIALCEAYGMTKDRKLRQPAQNALNFIAESQHPDFGGWRYEARFESDTSVSGWQLMALKSGEMAGLKIPEVTYAGVGTWLDSVEDEDAPGRFAYHPSKKPTDSMTAEGLLMRQYLGAGRDDGDLQAGASFLKSRLPRHDVRDVYYWYYATQVMFHMQGEYWDEWNATLRDMLVTSQDKAGPDQGSWDPSGDSKDTWGQSGGRHYVTCLNVLMLEVYYRHLPLYIKLNP